MNDPHWMPTSDVLTVEVRGPDRVRFLNGMLSNDVARLEPYAGHFAVKASPKGRTEGLLRVRAGPEQIYLDLDAASAELVAGSLVAHLVADDCQLVDRSDDWTVVRLLGPGVGERLRAMGWSTDMPDAHWVEDDAGRQLVRDQRFGVEGFELHLRSDEADSWEERWKQAGLRRLSPEGFDVLRVEAGVPGPGHELTTDVIPLEAHLSFAIDYEKGCYIGQETIARATHLGGVKYGLVGFAFGTPAPAAGAELFADQPKSVGEVTSVVTSDRLGGPVGLGFVRLTHAEPGTVLRTADGSTAEVRSLPLVPAQVSSPAFGRSQA
jgi:folate-binding protein YgfZ